LSFEITVGPPRLVIHQGQVILITRNDGQIAWPSNNGLYFFDTRLIGTWRVYANGEEWDLLNSGSISHYAARIFLINRPIETEEGRIPPRTLGLTLGRSIGGGVHEDIDIANHGTRPVRFNLEIAIRSDFADLPGASAGRAW
jgi:hypothetical protein